MSDGTKHTYVVVLKLDMEAESPIDAGKTFMNELVAMRDGGIDFMPVLEVRQFVDSGEDWKACNVDTYDWTIGDEWMHVPEVR